MIDRLTIRDNEKFLRQVSQPVLFPDSELNSDISKLKEYCSANTVFAMAAVQIGISKRLIYIKSTNPVKGNHIGVLDEEKIYINPKILSHKGKTEFWEACHSCLAENGKLFTSLIERPYEVEIIYQDINGKLKSEVLKGFESTVFLHEFDHLNGIFHMDKAKITITTTFEERNKLRNKEPYKIISKNSDFCIL